MPSVDPSLSFSEWAHALLEIVLAWSIHSVTCKERAGVQSQFLSHVEAYFCLPVLCREVQGLYNEDPRCLPWDRTCIITASRLPAGSGLQQRVISLLRGWSGHMHGIVYSGFPVFIIMCTAVEVVQSKTSWAYNSQSWRQHTWQSQAAWFLIAPGTETQINCSEN